MTWFYLPINPASLALGTGAVSFLYFYYNSHKPGMRGDGWDDLGAAWRAGASVFTAGSMATYGIGLVTNW